MQKKPKVAIVSEIPTPYRKGVFEKLLESKSFEFYIFYLSKHQKDRPWVLKEQLSQRITYLQSYQFNLYGKHTIYLTKGVKQLKSSGFEHFIIGGYAQPAMFSLLRHCWKKRIPYTMVTESHLQKERRAYLKLIKKRYLNKVYQRSTSNLITSSLAKEYVISYGANSEKIYIVPNSIDGPHFSQAILNLRQKKEELKRRLKILNKRIILFVGTLHTRKGVDLLCSAFAQLAQDFPDVGMIIIGEGPMEAELKQRIERDHLTTRVYMPGFIQEKELLSYYALSDLFVLPSREEPFGAVVCEAAAAGLPMITSSKVGANNDFVFPNQNGIIFDLSHPEELVSSMRLILENQSKAEKMGIASMKLMGRWSHDHIANQYMKAVAS